MLNLKVAMTKRRLRRGSNRKAGKEENINRILERNYLIFQRFCLDNRVHFTLLSTDISLPDEEVIRIYGKRWDIEVFFKMSKHHLNLEREMQLRDYDGLVAHTSLVFSRYMFLALQQRFHDDQRSIGSLFYACCDEIQDLTLLEAFHRLLTLALEKIRKSGEFAESVISSILDAIMGTAVDIIKSAQRLFLAST